LLSLLLTIVLGLSVEDRDNVTLIDSYTNTDTNTNTLLTDTLDVDETAPLPLRGGNVLVVLMSSDTNIDGVATADRGIVAYDLNDHYTIDEGVRGMELVKVQAHGETLIEAQRNALVALVANNSVVTNLNENSGITKDGRTITQSTYQQRMWLTLYVMKHTVMDDGVHVIGLVAYADVR
jgi:hypothetical protein